MACCCRNDWGNAVVHDAELPCWFDRDRQQEQHRDKAERLLLQLIEAQRFAELAGMT